MVLGISFFGKKAVCVQVVALRGHFDESLARLYGTQSVKGITPTVFLTSFGKACSVIVNEERVTTLMTATDATVDVSVLRAVVEESRLGKAMFASRLQVAAASALGICLKDAFSKVPPELVLTREWVAESKASALDVVGKLGKATGHLILGENLSARPRYISYF